MQNVRGFPIVIAFIALIAVPSRAGAQEGSAQERLDERVKGFLEKHESDWVDMNIPARDGRFLYDLIIRNRYTRALEIGTSTGHSAIWIAWALSRTGGKLITIEIDEDRHARAIENFREAGLSEFIDARLADAHELVRELKGPFDFVFSDADKGWNSRYFADLAPKMAVGGCYTTHNMGMHRGGGRGGGYLDFLQGYRNFETTVETDRTTGIAVSYKRSP